MKQRNVEQIASIPVCNREIRLRAICSYNQGSYRATIERN